MQASPTFSDIKSTVESGNPEIQIVFDQERAAQLGITVRELADRVVASVRGDVATRYKLREKKIDVLVRSVDTRASSVEEIRSLIVNPGSDRPLPLVCGRRSHGRDRARRDPPHPPAAGRDRVGQPVVAATSAPPSPSSAGSSHPSNCRSARQQPSADRATT